MRAFLGYLRQTQRVPEKFDHAAEEALSDLFTRWVLPQEPKDFWRYAKRTVWDRYIGGYSPARSRTINRATMDELHLRISEVARLSHMDLRRIYEAIKGGKLAAQKIGMSLRVEKSSAEKFISEALQKQHLKALRIQLEEMGERKNTIRKRVYRLERKGASEDELIQHLQIRLANYQRIGKAQERKQ